MTKPEPERLNSWKEIAQYFDVAVRTAQEWEKTRDLPIHRFPGPRSGVFARVDELRAWQLAAEPESAATDPHVADRPRGLADGSPAPSSPAVTRMSPLGLATAALVILLLALLLFTNRDALETSRPADWKTIGDDLVVTDDHERELWRVSFPEGLDSQFYGDYPIGRSMLADINGDGIDEMLFIQKTPRTTRSHVLVCYSAEGEELWRFTPGRDVSTSKGDSFSNIYWIGALDTVQFRDGRRGVAVSSFHHVEYPSQVVVVSADDGRTVAEYWHSGHVGNADGKLATHDLDGDGTTEIYAAGVNNAYEQATLVVLDPETMGGASVEENQSYQLVGFTRGRQIARVLFPKSSISRIQDRFNIAVEVQVTRGLIATGVRESLADPLAGVVHYLRPDFSLDRVSLDDSFFSVHAQLVREGKLDTTLDDEREALRSVQLIGGSRLSGALHRAR